MQNNIEMLEMGGWAYILAAVVLLVVSLIVARACAQAKVRRMTTGSDVVDSNIYVELQQVAVSAGVEAPRHETTLREVKDWMWDGAAGNSGVRAPAVAALGRGGADLGDSEFLHPFDMEAIDASRRRWRARPVGSEAFEHMPEDSWG